MRSDIIGVTGWIKNSFIDFPGTVSTVLFFSGCNLRCPYCHNPSIVCDESLAHVSSEEIWNFLIKRRNVLDGVVLSGGEPTLYDHMAETARSIRSLGYAVKLDTNGLLPDRIKEIGPDFLSLDIKTIPQNYTPLLKAGHIDIAERLQSSIAIARAMGSNAEIRITIAPEIINKEIIEELSLLLANIGKVWLQPMQTKAPMIDPAMSHKTAVPLKEILLYRDMLLRTVKSCEIRGYNPKQQLE